MKLKTVTMALSLGLTICAAQAHHSPPPLTETSTVVKGILRSVEFRNPHSAFTLEAKDASGKTVNWAFEAHPPAWFRVAGLRRADIAKGIGQQVTILARVAKDKSPFGVPNKITFADGTYIDLIEPQPAK